MDKYAGNAEYLLNNQPSDFQALYGQILKDACNILGEEPSNEYPEVEIPIYKLRTDKPESAEVLNPKDGLITSAYKSDVIRWIKRHNDYWGNPEVIEFAKKHNMNWSNPLPDKFFTVEHSIIDDKGDLGQRERNSLYRIIGAFRHLVRNHPASEEGKPLFKTDADLIKALENQYKDFGEGISNTNLTKIFPEANKLMNLRDD